MRLLIDEMYPPRVAEQLRTRSFDVIAVTERKELRALPDAAIFAVAQSERRAIVTENIGDFVALADAGEQRGVDHYGLILVDPHKFPRGRSRTIGALVKALETLLAEIPGGGARSLRHWL